MKIGTNDKYVETTYICGNYYQLIINVMYQKSNKKYRFNEIVANDAGFEEAVMFCNIFYWININKNKEDHFHEGRYWMYCTVREFKERYPFWSEAQIKRILRNLKKKDYIDTGEFNKWNPDRTKWYTITEKGLAIMNDDLQFANNDKSER